MIMIYNVLLIWLIMDHHNNSYGVLSEKVNMVDTVVDNNNNNNNRCSTLLIISNISNHYCLSRLLSSFMPTYGGKDYQ